MPNIPYNEEPTKGQRDAQPIQEPLGYDPYGAGESHDGRQPEPEPAEEVVTTNDRFPGGEPDAVPPVSPIQQNGSTTGTSSTGHSGNGMPDGTYERLRRRITAIQILAVVSLIIGGVILSTVALVLAILAHSQISATVKEMPGASPNLEAAWGQLAKSARIALAISALALILNAASLIILYPMLVDILQSSEYADLMGGTQIAPSGSRGSIWG